MLLLLAHIKKLQKSVWKKKTFLFLLLFSFNSIFAENKPSEKAKAGFLDLSSVNFDTEIINLDGEWEFYWNELIATEKRNPESLSKMMINVPDAWNGTEIGKEKLSGRGFASYRLKFRINKTDTPFALKALDMATSYSIWFNGEKIWSNGKVAKTKEESVPEFKPNTVFLSNLKEENEIIVEVSNYHHFKGGFWESLKIGRLENLILFREKRFGFDLFLSGSLLIMGIYHFGLFSLRRKDKSTLLLGIFCFIMLFRLLTTGERIFFVVFPILGWDFWLRVEYLSFYLATPVFAAFLHSLYPLEFTRRATQIGILGSSVFCLFVIFGTAKFFSSTPIPFQIFTVLFLIYGFVQLTRASLRKREGGIFALIGFIMLLLTTVNDILYGNFIINTTYLSPYGFFAFIFTQAFILSVRFSKAFLNVELLTEDLQKTNHAYSRFVPKEFLSYLKKNNIMDVTPGDQVKKEMTILFSDIRSFTNMSENMTPEENFDFVNSYLAVMNPIIKKNQGFVDKFIGDAIMALFPDSPENAITAGIEMQHGLKEFNIKRLKENKELIQVGIGIHTGSLMLGTVGDSDRMEGTVISDAVNLASRIEGITKVYGANIIISEQTLTAMTDSSKYALRFLGKVEVKGKKDPATVFEIYEADDADVRERKIESQIMFERGIHDFLTGNSHNAKLLFEEILEKNPKDLPAYKYLQKCSLIDSVKPADVDY